MSGFCVTRNLFKNLCASRALHKQIAVRCLANSPALFKVKTDEQPAKKESDKDTDSDDEKEQKGWLSKLFHKDFNPVKESHSSLLAAKDVVYELQFHAVRPDCMEEYLREFRTFMGLTAKMDTGAELAGSWTVEVGNLDEAVHLWKFDGGYPVLNKHKHILRTNEDFLEFRRRRNKMLRSRRNQILLAFSFWKTIEPRTEPHIYELRSYTLKPGTMIEWGNHWARGLKHRQAQNEPVIGMFSHIGDLYQAHHVWAYKSLQSRQEVREAAWSKPGWDETVLNTVPLIRHMTSRILIPTPFSPLK